MSATQLLLFGSPRVRRANGPDVALPWHRTVGMLAYVACHADGVTREAVACLLRPDSGADAARAYLRRTLHRLRETLPDVGCVLDADGDRLVWRGGCDVVAFDAAIAARDWRRAIELHAAPLLAGVPSFGDGGFDPWLDDERLRLRRKLRLALVSQIDHEHAAGRHAAAIDFMQRLVDDDPLDEDGVQFLLEHAATEPQRQLALGAFETLQRQLALELATKPMPRTAALAAALRAGAQRVAVEPAPACPAPAAPSPPPGDAVPDPEGLGALVGREREVERVEALLATPEVRLVTLRGTGGIGKTRMARELWRRSRDGGRAAWAWADMACAETPRGFWDALVAGLGIALREGPVDEQVAHWLHERSTCIVADNFEQLLPHAGLLADLLRRAPKVRWLVTSREALGLEQEHVVELGGLGVADAHDAAARLLRAHAERLGHRLPKDDAGLTRLVRVLGGLPLAIELAAPWTAVMSPGEIADEISRDVGFLDAGGDSPRSLRAVFASTWQRLGAAEQAALQALVTIHGGIDRAAAHEVGGADAAMLRRLTKRSLLHRADDGRFGVHPLVRQFVIAHTDEDERERLRARHARHFVAWLAAPPPLHLGAPDPVRLAHLGANLDDVVVAWRWCVDQGRFDLVERALRHLVALLFMTARFEEAVELTSLAADALPAALPLRAALDAVHAAAAVQLGRPSEAERVAERALAMPAASSEALALLKLVKSRVHAFRGEHELALQWSASALEAATSADDPYLEMRVLQNVGSAAWALGRLAEAEATFLRLLALAECHAAALLRARAQRLLAIVRDSQQRPLEALPLLDASTAYFAQRGDAFEVAFNQRVASYVHMALGQFERQRALAQASVDALREIGYPHELGESLFALAMALDATGEADAAADACRRALRLALRERQVPLALRCIGGLGALSAAHDRARGLALMHFVIGHPSLKRPDLAFLERRLRRMAVGDDEAERARRAATALTLDAVTAELLAFGP